MHLINWEICRKAGGFSLRRVCVLRFRAGGMVLFIPWRGGAERRAGSCPSCRPRRRAGGPGIGLNARAPAQPAPRPPSPDVARSAALFNQRAWDGLRAMQARRRAVGPVYVPAARRHRRRAYVTGVDGRSDQLRPRLPLCPLRQDQLRVVDDRMSRAPRLAAATAAAPAPPASARRPRSSQTEKAKQKSAAARGAASRAWKTP